MPAITAEFGKLIGKIPENLTSKLVNKGPIQLIEDKLLEGSNAKSAKKIASMVTEYGENRFGGPWSEKRLVLLDGREVYLQSSADALEILIPRTNSDPNETHVRLNLPKREITTYDVQGLDGQALIYYQVLRPENNFPKTLSRSDILREVGDILTQVEQVTLKPKS